MEIIRNKYTFTNINYEGLNLNEDEIMSKYSKAFTLLTKRFMDVLQFPCLSCEKLFEKISLTLLNSENLYQESSGTN